MSPRLKKTILSVFLVATIFAGVFSPLLGLKTAYGVVQIQVCDPGAVFQIGYQFSLDACIDKVGVLIVEIMSWLLGLAGKLLNASIEISIVRMNEFVSNIGGIQAGWVVVRDAINISFIFALLYIAISTILQTEKSFGTQKLLINLILAALLINFSLVMTKTIVDSGNVLTVGIYRTLQGPQSSGNNAIGQAITNPNYGISGQFMQHLRITTFKDPKNFTGDNIFMIAVFTSIFILITSFIFGAAAILFLIRFVTLIFLMVISPVAFAGLILPNWKKYSTQWWDTLWCNVFFAPLYMLLILIVLKIIADPNFKDSMYGGLDGSNNFANALSPSGSALIFVNFFIISVMMVSTLIIAKKWGCAGGTAVAGFGAKIGKWGQGVAIAGAGAATVGATGFAARNTVGRAASKFASTDLAKRMGTTRAGSAVLKGMRGVAGASFDVRNTGLGGTLPLGKGGGKGGYEKKLKDQREARKKYAEAFGKGPKGDALREKYADTLANTRSADTLWLKTARKDKEAAKEIADDLKKNRRKAELNANKKALAAKEKEKQTLETYTERPTDLAEKTRLEAERARINKQLSNRKLPVGQALVLSQERIELDKSLKALEQKIVANDKDVLSLGITSVRGAQDRINDLVGEIKTLQEEVEKGEDLAREITVNTTSAPAPAPAPKP